MKVPMSWFNDYTDISGVTPAEYDHVLTMSGSKVEEVVNMGGDINKVVTGKLLDVTAHQDSDHLVICKVDVGAAEPIQIVTGAPNVAPGQVVPVALHGSTLPGGVSIKKGKLRGVESNGMLCSADELGITAQDLGYEPEYGILILPKNTPVGTDIKDIFGLNENVVEYEITSNRPDCFSVIGLARETAASFKKPFKVKTPVVHENNENISDFLKVSVENKEKCLRYSARMIKNVKIGPSPKWMVHRLKASGIRSINNIVDITNYVLLEYGQPMHAFDLRDLSGASITVRSAKDGEKIKTLDEQDRVLTENDLVISDASRAVAVAGVMGGFNSEIKDDTQTVVFESATFDGPSVRLTAQRLGLRTESSSRYEKGLDPNNTIPAVMRACELVEELGGGEVVGGCIDIIGKMPEKMTLPFRPDYINHFLGTDIPTEDMIKYLTAIEFDVDAEKGTVTAPTFRPDIIGEADVAEEVARFYGYDKIPTTLLSGEATAGKISEKQEVVNKINTLLTSQGLYEIYTYTFVSPTMLDKLCIPENSSLRNTVKISNPLGEDTSIMRTTTIGSMLEILSRNYKYKNTSAKLFEIGKTYMPVEGEKLPNEPETVTFGLYGDDIDFFDLKGICETLTENLHSKKIEYRAKSDNPTFHPGRCAEILSDGKVIGILGQIHPTVAENFEISVACYVAEIDLGGLMDSINDNVTFKPIPKYPAAERDIAMLVDKSVPVADIEKVMKKAGGAILEDIKLFDVYEGKQIPDGKKSVAYSILFRDNTRSLTNEEVNTVFDKILKKLEKELSAQLR